jgi:glycosyltransferase involved in cell wall biosynthesis
MEIKGKNIVVIGLQPWDISIGSNCKNIAVELAKCNRVLYVNAPVDRFSLWKHKGTTQMQKRRRVRKGTENGLVQIQSNLWNLYPANIIESVNWLPDGRVFDAVNKLNARRFVTDIKKAMLALGFADFVLFNDNSIYLGVYIRQMLQPDVYIYYIRDHLTKNPYWSRHGVRLEPQVIGSADVVVTNSDYYAEYARQFNRHAYMIGQGCDLSGFDKPVDVPDAAMIRNLQRPVLGYVGMLSARRLDIKLLEAIAVSRKDISLVLVGPQDDVFAQSSLHQFAHVHFLGSKPADHLPALIRSFDVAINPQLINEATMGNYPRKIDEYLAMGKPVLAMATKGMAYFKDVVYLASSTQEFLQLIDVAIKEDTEALQEKRKSTAQSHSWNNSVQLIGKALYAATSNH